MDKDIVLFEDKKDCCGCGACYNVCPKQAISMQEDEYGYVYPIINKEKCVRCGMCKRVCGINNPMQVYLPQSVYAVSTRDKEKLINSSSGGAFYTIAEHVIKRGGLVYGVAYDKEGVLYPKHVCVETIDGLKSLQGSKYVQSDTGVIFKEIKQNVDIGKLVLFSGTPCQGASLRRYVGGKCDNLIIVELICHGVPNKRMFQDFIRYKEKKLMGHITDFKFRDKTKGQGYTLNIEVSLKEKKKRVIRKGELEAYVRFFSKSLILRESCYECKFAKRDRGADITIGDFWGFKEEHKDEYDGNINDYFGVSCLLCNTTKGKKLLEECRGQFYIVDSEYEKVAKNNKQLNNPTPINLRRQEVLECYKNRGYEGLEHLYWELFPLDKIKYFISSCIPEKIKRNLK